MRRARPRILEPLDPQETEEPPPIVEEEELVPDVMADPPSAGDMDVDLPGSVREDVPDWSYGRRLIVEVASWTGPLARS